ncbi:hypothetical protein BAUCODRAFT_38263 [Baudoinia panamericana UAMH 10762]|uniref:Endonuclease/exonuclease/phosphatase domain-containing protein n=1 Tax=Baudoinia panamericana (strain UAMH 10762) TaxID=717646 RepID=M2MZY6_BAUPA|nr:uncharacterized protein BAUCODRAFT_38263 [Baudoinia panamericana UAMH 10762]EMC92239.1 hypothetical protein BAUCODRAFT_38263 [Baudoinia panamericana UAMH 10762]
MSRTVSPPPSKRRKTSVSSAAPLEDLQLFRIYSHNVNGIQPYLQRSITSFFQYSAHNPEPRAHAHASLRDFLRRHHWPELLFLQEVKINPDDIATIRAFERSVRPNIDDAGAPDYVTFTCLPSDKFNARGFGRKVYGVASIIRKDFHDQYVERVRHVDWDLEGRFLVIETKPIRNILRLAIFNVYAVNGTDNPYKDPMTGEVCGTRHDRKLKVHSLLQSECRKLERRGFRIIIAGDLNIARHRIDGHPNLRTFPYQHCLNRADFEARFFGHSIAEHSDTETTRSQVDIKDVSNPSAVIEETGSSLGMVDTFRYLHPHQKGYTYYSRARPFGESCDRVDMIIVSSSLKPYLRDAGMLATPAERGPSDHVPLYAGLDFGRSLEWLMRKHSQSNIHQ